MFRTLDEKGARFIASLEATIMVHNLMQSTVSGEQHADGPIKILRAPGTARVRYARCRISWLVILQVHSKRYMSVKTPNNRPPLVGRLHRHVSV